ncbi:MAG: amidohydrolase family protein [Candidatus Limnocylindrales bacterium]
MRVDAHHHTWDLATGMYRWPTPAEGPIFRTIEVDEIEPHLSAAGIDRTVLVQAANDTRETETMLRAADARAWIGAVVGWVPLERPSDATGYLDAFCRHRRFRGVRHLIHNEADPDWIVQPAVLDGLAMLEERGLAYDVVAVYPDHLRHVPALAGRFPTLTLVIDHLAKPPFGTDRMADWAALLTASADHPNVVAKVSGLDTAAGPGWSADTLRPAVDVAFDVFGADRLMFGSDWPVSELGGGYERVFAATEELLADRSAEEREAVLGGTASRVYRIEATEPGEEVAG